MLSERLLPALLALLVLSAVVAPLSASIASDRGEELVVERLVVLDSSGRMRRVESLGWRVPLAQPDCPSCVRPGLEVLSERVLVLANESRSSGRVTESLMAVRVERVVRDPSRPCLVYVGLDAVVYARETPTYRASMVLLNIRNPRDGYVGSVAFVKVFPKDGEPTPRGGVVVVEKPGSVGRALGLAVSHLRVDAGSVMRRLGLVSAASEVVTGLASMTSGRVGWTLEGETRFLAVVFADPEMKYWRAGLALAGESEPDPLSSGDVWEPDEGYECITDQDCWVMYNDYNCICVTDCVEYDIWKLIGCITLTGGCSICIVPCMIEYVG